MTTQAKIEDEIINKAVKDAMNQLDYVGAERQRMEDLLYFLFKQGFNLGITEGKIQKCAHFCPLNLDRLKEKMIDEVLDVLNEWVHSNFDNRVSRKSCTILWLEQLQELKQKLNQLKEQEK